jgi:hypothetical protein
MDILEFGCDVSKKIYIKSLFVDIQIRWRMTISFAGYRGCPNPSNWVAVLYIGIDRLVPLQKQVWGKSNKGRTVP